jgi:hypothetical protein
MTYSTSNNINVYKNINIVDPTNADRSNGALILKDPGDNVNQYIPKIGSTAGTNFVYRLEKKTYFSIDGSDYIDLIVSQEIFLTFGVTATTENAFFNSAKLVSNIATLLGVPATMIRRVKPVTDTGSSSRVARDSSNKIVQMEVTLSTDPPSLSTDTDQTLSNIDQIGSVTANISGKFYFGQLQDIGTQNGLKITSLTLQTSDNSTDLKEIGSLKLVQDASKCRAQSPCEVQPSLQLLDKNVKLTSFIQ